MKHFIPILAVFGLLNACSSPLYQSSQTIGSSANCPEQAEPMPIAMEGDEAFYDHFDYHTRNIVADTDTVKFKTLQHDFVYCRGDRNWTVQPGTLPEELQPPQPEQFQQELNSPSYQTVELNGQTYQYRVILEPNPFTSDEQRQEPEEVVFELIAPDSEQPQRQTLYTLEQVKQAEIGSGLGVPRVTAAVDYENRLFWSVASEQGEGFSGIATVVGYNPVADEFVMIQPPELQGQQITDLVIAGDSTNPVFWMGTQMSGEGSPYLPGMGLVAYRPTPPRVTSGSITAYHVRNSPIVGAIVDQVLLESERLWVSTGNGICQVKWQGADNPQNWSCWRFAAMAKLPSEGLPLYSSLQDQTVDATLPPDEETVEVLWWMPIDYETRNGRYEVRYDEGFNAALEGQGAVPWSELYQSSRQPNSWQPSVYWLGREWHWNGDRFVRGFDEVALSLFGGGPHGIEPDTAEVGSRPDVNAIRGDLELLELTENSTSVKHYSGWVEENALEPYLTVVPQQPILNPRPNPLMDFRE
ncbi:MULTISPECIES: hypothetical protein [unclassified Coleofasciculus]|uniref:hypothetical protein n=1 Tax=unclassified Coleofasciculus TaxID=2692782 RepID=UPI0018823386|nr:MULTISPECIES: hypothetical protein [unclassified Coleofasciculus]MBE9126074.1 hypothetical protein [Coleofasciculus sp. LEGE 07081]MBE9149487.1 hypothetical protein [Coleofasciculus sp. LEGE 07092]